MGALVQVLAAILLVVMVENSMEAPLQLMSAPVGDVTYLNNEFSHCYEIGVNQSLPRTTDQMIDLIARIESKIDLKYSSSELASILISKFRFDKVKQGRYLSVDSRDFMRQERLFGLIKDFSNDRTYAELNKTINEELSLAEKCNMFFMLSSSFKHKKQQPAKRSTEITEKLYHADPMIFASTLKEMEVIGTMYNIYGTVEGGSVLAGIAAGHPSGDRIFHTHKIKSVYAVTIANMMSKALAGVATGDVPLDYMFGTNGTWNSNISCPRSFTFNHENRYSSYGSKRITDPEILGSVDGFNLGNNVISMEEQGYSLSTMLRYYYGNSELESPFASACSRWEMFRHRHGELLDQTDAVMHLLEEHDDMLEDIFDKESGDIYNHFMNNVVIRLAEKQKPRCLANVTESFPICMNNAEVIVVLDQKAQKDTNLLASLLLNMQNTNGSTIGVYTNELDSIKHLTSLASLNSGLTKSEIVCKTSQFESNGANPMLFSRTISAINDFYYSQKKDKSDLAYFPPKVVILMNSGSINGEKAEKEYNNLVNFQPDITLLMMVEDTASVNKLPITNVFPLSTTALEDINKRICSVPGKLHYHYCNSKDSSYEAKFTHRGAVKPRTVKYLEVDSKYFKSSSSVKITFKIMAEFGGVKPEMKISKGRKTLLTNDPDAVTLDQTKNEHTFEVKTPCDKFETGKCPPITFSITGVSCNDIHNFCCKYKDICSSPDQIVYEVSHEGLYCAGNLPLTSTVLQFVSLLVMLASRYVFNV